MWQIFAVAQQRNYTAFTVNDGLPSNHVYQCVEDDHGFLWIATDAGIARFDGNHFQVFTTDHGLPDNEVLQVVKEKDGTIWVNCFKEGAAYFDELKNRFISSNKDSAVKISGTTVINLFALPGGGVQYHSENGTTIFRNKKPVYKYANISLGRSYIRDMEDGSVLWWRAYNKGMRCFIVNSSGQKNVDSVSIGPYNGTYFTAHDDYRYYAYRRDSNFCIIYSNFKTNPLRFKVDTLSIPEPFFHLSFSRSHFYMITHSGKIYVLNKETRRVEKIISGSFLPNGYYNDSKGNIWISTIDKGLLVYRKKHVASIDMPADFTRTNFISLARNDGGLLAGNYYGEVIEVRSKRIVTHTIIKKTPSRQRKIIVAGKKIYTISEDGIFMNYKEKIKLQSGKTAVLYNDTLLIIGSAGGVATIDLRTNQVIKNLRYKRITALTKSNNRIIYIGSTDGLHTYDPLNDSFRSLSSISPLLTDRIAALSITRDDILWIATSGKGLVALRNNKVLANITTSDGIISNASRCMNASTPGQVWLGTAQGISVVSYKLINNRLTYSIQNISINDGLVSNEINDLLFANDTMFIATGNGLSLMPAKFTMPGFNIPIKLTRININQQDTIISNHYQLDHNQQNIQLQFAAIELNGHFKNFQYLIDQSHDWIYLPGRTLSIQLGSGAHTIHVRAVDVNGNISKDILSLKFDIATPFWKSFWFWLIIAVACQFMIIYLVNRRQKKKKERRLQKELAVVQTASLEQQAFTSLMNPHFMFNALNSIQHYINVQDRQKANRYLSDFASLIRKNFESAQQSFIPLDQELESIRIYLRLEQMRFTEKFRYTIEIDDDLETEGWMIPTMILQPLLENAVLHGLMPSSLPGELSIEIKEEQNQLIIFITDNGIGIKNSNALKQNNNHRSHGMDLIKKRVKALSHFSGDPFTLTMMPAFDSIQNPGNKIIITIPAALHSAWIHVQQKNIRPVESN